MSVEWIKLSVGIFDNRKIRQIEALPDGDTMIVIWISLLCLAGKINDAGRIYFADGIPYTDQMLAVELNRPLASVQMALGMFEKFGMIERGDVITIPGWERHQNVEGMEKMREASRIRSRNYRERQKSLPSRDESRDASRDVTDTEIEEEKEKEKDIIPSSYDPSENRNECPYKRIMEMFNSICTSYPSIRAIEGTRRTAVGARWRTAKSIEAFEEIFKIAEASSFMKGKNSKNWSADFDWMMKASNWQKIAEHKYDDRKPAAQKSSYGSFDTDDFIAAAMARSEEEMRKRDWSLNTGYDDDDGESSGFSLT